jgi:hypothetical protein
MPYSKHDYTAIYLEQQCGTWSVFPLTLEYQTFPRMDFFISKIFISTTIYANFLSNFIDASSVSTFILKKQHENGF